MPSKRPKYFSMHDDEEFKVLDAVGRSLETMTEEEFTASLIRAGMITKSGRLTKPFRELYEADMAIIEAHNARLAREQGLAQPTPAPGTPGHMPGRAQPASHEPRAAAPRRKAAAASRRKAAAPVKKTAAPRRKSAASHRAASTTRRKRRP